MEDSKNAIMKKITGKQLCAAFEKYVNAELEEIIVTETNHYALKRTQTVLSQLRILRHSMLYSFHCTECIAVVGYYSLP